MSMKQPGIKIEAIGGNIFLPELNLWLDPKSGKKNAYISHAHADHFSRSENIISSSETAHLLRSRFGVRSSSLSPVQIGKPFRLDHFDIQLLSAGHIVGSSMILIRNCKTSATLLYTGDFKVDSSRTCKSASDCNADTLIMETTFGHPKYNFPTRKDTEKAMLSFVNGALKDNQIPIIYCYSLGKAQEVSCIIGEKNIPIFTHKSIFDMNEACREMGIVIPDSLKLSTSSSLSEHVVICPPSAGKLKFLSQLKNKRTAMISGWGIDESAKYRYKVDDVFPLSDHADYQQLINFVEKVNPKTVYTVHGFTERFAADLRRAGRTAWSLFKSDQLDLFDKRIKD
ncbi:MBL fold metallo-hydrolase [Verrucomicrobiales bacterium]|nr:MBL fold metallo-hydrolase [Verrucomicrobiales bacterium]